MDENTVSQVNYETRINKVLEKLLDPKFKLRNDVYLNSLLSYFVGKTENKFYNSAVFMETFLSWIITATSQWEKKPLPSPDIFVFALNLTSFISKEEIIFVRLNSQELYERLLKLIQSQEYSTAPSVKLAYINMLSSFLEHKSGKQWIIATNYWTEILGLTLRSETHYISKEGCKFLIKLLSATIKLNERFCVNVIQMVLEPLVNFKPTQSNILCQAGNNLVIQDQAIYQSLCATITLTTELLEKFLENIGSKCSRDIFNLFVEKFQLENLINNVLMVAQSEDFVYDLNRVLCILALYEILVKLEGMKTVSYEQAFPHIKKLFKILMDNIQKGYVANVLKLCYMTQIYYKSISNYMPVCTKKEKDILLFENQIMLMQITPVYQVSLNLSRNIKRPAEYEWMRELYLNKLFTISGSHTVHLVQAWKVKLSELSGFDTTSLALTYMLNSKKFFTRQSGAIVFQFFIYTLKDIMHAVAGDTSLAGSLMNETNMIGLLLEGIVTYIKEFDLSYKDWLDSFELICVTAITFHFLNMCPWTSQVFVYGLQITNLSIESFEEKFCTSRNDIREMYALQFWKKMGVACRTIRIFWAWRDVLLGHTDLPYITLLSLTYLSQLHQYINRDSATMIFELFVYSLKDYVDLVKEDPKAIHNICEDINIKECIMDNIHTYLQNFEFSWLEAIGTISLMDIALDYLCLYEWMSYKMLAYELGLTNLSIETLRKFCSPENDIRDMYMEQFWKKMGVTCRTIKIFWAWRDALRDQENLPYITVLSLKYISELHQYINRDTAKIMFEFFVCSLKDCVDLVKEDPRSIHLIFHDINIQESIMDNIYTYLENFEFSWIEAIGTISLVDIALDYLGLHDWKSKKVFAFDTKLLNVSMGTMMSDLWGVREIYIRRIFGLTVENHRIGNIIWKWRDVLMQHPSLPLLTSLCLEYTSLLQDYIGRNMAASVLQTYLYTLGDLVCLMKKDCANIEILMAHQGILERLMANINEYVLKFNFKWTETVETISLMDVSINFLYLIQWEFKIYACDIRLLNKSIDNLYTELFEGVREAYYEKCCQMVVSHERTARSSWEWRDLMLQHREVLSITTLCLKYTLLLKDYIDRDTGAFVLQSFIYILEDFLRILNEHPEKVDILSQNCTLEHLMENIEEYIQKFSFTWSETVETISVLDITLDLLCLHTWKSKIYAYDIRMFNKSLETLYTELFEGVRGAYYEKCCQMFVSHERTARSSWEWRDLMLQHREVLSLTTLCLKYTLSLKDYINRDTAAFILQTFIYVLEDFLRILMEHPEKVSILSQNCTLEHLMENIVEYVKKFCFTWSETVETISVLDIALDLLCLHTWKSKMYVYDIRIHNKSIETLCTELFEGVRAAYSEKCCKILISHERTAKASWEWRDLMLQHGELLSLITLSIKYTLSLKDYVNRDIAIFLLETFIYFLEDCLRILKEDPQKVGMLSQNRTLEHLIENIGEYIEKFCFTWSETVKTTSVLDSALDLLSLDTWKSEISNKDTECLDNVEAFRDLWQTKILKIMAEYTLKFMYVYRDIYLHSSVPLFEHGVFSLIMILKTMPLFCQEVGIVLFECLTYTLEDIVNSMKENPEQVQLVVRETKFTELFIECMTKTIESFDCSWKETKESFYPMELIIMFLNLIPWTCKLVVKALKLVDISIKKYMTPNMALLVDRTNDSTLALVGPLLYAKLHDSTWEVRDSALEVICTLAYNANTRFPSFQKIILDAEIVPLVVKMALNDGESYVRATALKCLQEIIQVSDFWEKLLSVDNLHEDLLAILQKEPEGLVRQEGATLISKIYEHQTFPDTLLPEVFDVMSHAATSDLHWEVKVNALNFWENVINNHLQHQGMIDGSFPNVTFSKEHKKIVTLNEAEVKKRLIKVLHQLSNVGCLSVLVTAVQDDCDVEVAKAATKITKNFVELLQKYNVDSTSCKTSESSTPVTTPTEELPFSPMLQSENFCNTPMSTDQTDRIIDEIINTRDEMLLVTVCNPSDQPMSADLPKISGKKICLPSEFVKFSYDDLESYETEKRKWLNNIDDFGSLLDDILREYNDSDVNSMDCY